MSIISMVPLILKTRAMNTRLLILSFKNSFDKTATNTGDVHIAISVAVETIASETAEKKLN